MEELQPGQGVPSSNVQVQPTTNIARTRSRIGFAFYISIIALWVLVIMSATVINAILGNALGYDKGDFGTSLVMLIALAVPLVPLFMYSHNQLQKMLADPANFEDMSFKKSVRSSLFLALFLGVLNVVVGLYGTLDVLILRGNGDGLQSFMHLLIFGGGFGILAFYSWSFHKRTRS